MLLRPSWVGPGHVDQLGASGMARGGLQGPLWPIEKERDVMWHRVPSTEKDKLVGLEVCGPFRV